MLNSQNKPKEIAMDFFLLNNKMRTCNEFDQSKTSIYPSFYEVIRIIDGVPLFFEEHIDRLVKSLHMLNYELPCTENTIKTQIHNLIKINNCYNYNVKIVVNDLDDQNPNLFIYFISSKYPKDETYNKGVHTILYKGERDNPNAKIIAESFREKVNKKIQEENAYEALLVTQKNEITEGSRSNMFFVKNNTFYTSPGKDVLVGITRSQVINLCRKLGYKVKEEIIPVSLLDEIDGLFLTGTSPKVLPISSVDNKKYKSTTNTSILDLKKAYDDLINDYVNKNKGSMN